MQGVFMPDLKRRIADILKPLQLSSFATITAEGKPWVRYVMTDGLDDFTIRLATFKEARKVAHIRNHPEVHLTCGVTAPRVIKPYLQIEGLASETDDPRMKKSFWNPTMASYFLGPDDPNYVLLLVKPYRIELCSPGSLEPEVWTSGK